LVAKNIGPEFLDDPQRFNRLSRIGTFSELDSELLNDVRRVVEAVGYSEPQPNIIFNEALQDTR